MREIKFRAWDKKKNAMHYFPLSNEGDMLNFIVIKGKLMLAAVNNGEIWNVEWMQYTGLKDKNGKEIYEGDILAVDDTRLTQVVWHDKAGCWDTKYISDKLPRRTFDGLRNQDLDIRTVVIGNIYSNPELLDSQ